MTQISLSIRALASALLSVLRTIARGFKTVAGKLNPYASLIVAAATIALAITTYLYIGEVRDMRDVTIKQFMVISYPTLHVVVEDPSLETNRIVDKVRISNTGSIAAFHSTQLFFHVYRKEKKALNFKPLLGALYSGEENITAIDYSKDILPGKAIESEIATHFDETTTKENLQYFLLFIRFWVPYDDRFSYRTFGYILKELPKQDDSQNTRYKWQYLTDEDLRAVCDRVVKTYRSGKYENNKKILDFLQDYK